MNACARADMVNGDALAESGFDELPGGKRRAGLEETAAIEDSWLGSILRMRALNMTFLPLLFLR